MRKSIRRVVVSVPLLVGALCLAGCNEGPAVPADKNPSVQIQQANGPNPSAPNLPGGGGGASGGAGGATGTTPGAGGGATGH